MRDITIRNFRCYSYKQISFRRGINLLIGDNSVGKTSLLRACNLVINSFFSGFSDENTSWKSADDDDFREIKTDEVQTNEQPIIISFHFDEYDCPPIVLSDGSIVSLEAKQSIEDNSGKPDLLIEKKSKKNARNLVTGLKPLKNYASLLQKNSHIIDNDKPIQLNALPLFAYFTTEDIHTIRKFDKEKKNFKKYPQKPSFGYFESFDCKGLLDCWLKRLLVLKEANKGETEIECVEQAIAEALGQKGCNIIADMKIMPNDGQIYFELGDKREVRSDLLSDGYRRLVSIVVDIAMRSALLNKVRFGKEAYKHTHGTVIIDEIDEHLHPELQVRVLKALHDTFPKLQFIVSTHSPLVISSVENSENNAVFRLEFKDGVYSHVELSTYGIDANSILEGNMETIVRPIDIDNKIKNIRALLADKKITEAKTELSELETKTNSQQTDLTQLRAIINRLEILSL